MKDISSPQPTLRVVSNYRPYSKPTSFNVVVDRGGVQGLWHRQLRYLVRWPRRSSAPRTGVLLCHYLNSISARDAFVLDIGTGTGLLAMHCARIGARRVIGIDVDAVALEVARRNVDENGLQDIVALENGDVSSFSTKDKAGLIVANLPHMPVPKLVSPHDDGGRDGRMCVLELIGLAQRCLHPNGVAIFTAPDYLGITRRYSSTPSLKEIAKKSGFIIRVERRYKMEVRPSSYTATNKKWISTVYPRYTFGRSNKGMPTHWLFLASMRFCNERKSNE